MTQPLGAAALPRFLAHSAAGAAAGCAAVHGLGLALAPHPDAAGTALLAAACLACAVHLWRRPGRAAWAAHVVLTTAMLAVHPPVLTAHLHHAATGPVAWAGPVAGLLAVVALLLAAVRGYGAVHRPAGVSATSRRVRAERRGRDRPAGSPARTTAARVERGHDDAVPGMAPPVLGFRPT
ncbi:hypothetical protein [Geodermatophilus maliterrae]|uniref:Uncharacterized protein n=1 Tax=Geodermatophilus maliterrae TaxID=3162531 RepID=A0ABV3XIT1_9ACTN